MKTLPNKNRVHQIGRTSFYILVGIAAFAVGITLYYFTSESRQADLNKLQHATSLFSGARDFPKFTLMDHHGKKFSNKNLDNAWNFVFFGFTHCPDVCPLTLSTIDKVLNNITAQQDIKARGVFISVDPKRDTHDRLKSYVQHFNHDMIGLTGTDKELKNLTQALGVVYTSPDKNEDQNYLIDHSAHIFLVAPNGVLAALFSTPHKTQTITGDFKILNAHYNIQQGS